MRILFAGSSGIAAPCLDLLSEMETEGKDLQLVAILTNPDAPRGRSNTPIPTEISVSAGVLSLLRVNKGFSPVVQFRFEKLDSLARERIAASRCDLLVSFAYGRIFGPKFLSLFPMGGINIHPSLLPKYRGPSPISAAIMNNDSETGITIQMLSPEIDAGDILAQRRFSLDGDETAGSLSESLSREAAVLLSEVMPDLISGSAKRQPQQGEAVYCKMITKEQGHIDWNLSAKEIDALVRAYYPWPLCFTQYRDETLFISRGCVPKGEDLNINSAYPYSVTPLPGYVLGIDRVNGILIQTGDGVFAVSRLQRQAKKVLEWRDFLNGARDFIGSRLE